MPLSPVPTLRQKKGTEKLAPISCAHVEAEERIQELLAVRRIGISKDSNLCASAHRCPHYAYARLIARVLLSYANACSNF